MNYSSPQIIKDLSVSMFRASLASVIFAIPLAIVSAVPYLFIWGMNPLTLAVGEISKNYFAAIILLLAGILFHELIHGVSWMLFGKKPAKSIRYGFNWKSLAAYAHCNEPMSVSTYRLSIIMPGLLLGVLPVVAALITGNPYLMLFGLLFTVAASGDMFILWLLRRETPDSLVMDHPTNAGCMLVEDSF